MIQFAGISVGFGFAGDGVSPPDDALLEEALD